MDFGFTPYSSNILGGFKAPNAQPSGAKLTQSRQKQYFENTSLPGVSEPNAQKIIQYVNTNAKSEEEKKLLTQDLRQAGIKLEQKKAYQDERNGMKAQITSDWVNEKDPVKRSSLEQTVKLANFADVLKAKLETEGVDTDTIKDEDIVGRYVNLGQKESETFANYLNNKITSVDFGRELGLIKEEEPTPEIELKNPLLRGGEGLLGAGVGAVKGAYEGLVPGFEQMTTDIKRIVNDPNKGLAEKWNQIIFGEIGADYIGGVIGKTFGGALEGLYNGFTTESERGAIDNQVKGIMDGLIKKEPIQNIMKQYNNLDETQKQDLNDLMGYAMNATELLGIGLLGSPAQQAGKKLLKTGAEVLDETLGGATEAVGKKLAKVGEFSPVESTARLLTNTAKAEDKLFKAQNPSINILNKNRNLKTIREESDIANRLIVENGHKPVDTETRRIAHEKTMESKWKEIENQVKDKKTYYVDQRELAYELERFIKEQKKLGVVETQGDIIALEKQAKALRDQRYIDIPTLEKKKQVINGIVNNWGDSKVGDVYKNGMKKLTAKIGELEDSVLSKIPGDFSKQKKEFGALKATYEDVLKADIKNQKAKGMNIIESYSKIEGITDILGGAMSVFTKGSEGVKDVVKGVGKVFLGKALKKTNDADFLVKEGFEELSKNIPVKLQSKLPTPKTPDISIRNPVEAKASNPVVRMNGDIDKQKLNELVAIHNLSEEKLKKITELGGLPAPSIAITKKGIPFEDFGDITLVGNKDLIQSKGSNIYTTDVYSPRVTQPTLVPKKGKELNDLVSKIAKETNQPEWRISNKIDNWSDKKYIIEDMPELAKYESDIDNMFEKKIFKGFSYAGNRQYKAYTLDNVLKDMLSRGKQGSESSIFEGSLNQMTAKEANKVGLSQLKKFNFSEKGKLDDVYKAVDDKWNDIIAKVSDKTGKSPFDVARNFAYELSIKRPTESIISELNKYGFASVDISDIEAAKSIIKEALSLPKSYVEAKIWRGVGLDEFSSVLVPETKVSQVKEILKGTKLEDKIVSYKQGESRTAKLNEISKKYGNIFFGVGGVMIPGYMLMGNN